MVTTSEEQFTIEDIRDIWPGLTPDERIEAFELLSRESSQEFFLTLSSKERAAIVMGAPLGERRIWMRLLAPDEVADLIQTSPEDTRIDLMQLLDERTRQEVNALLSYKQDAAGGLMNPRFIRMRPDLTADEGIRYVRLQMQEHAEEAAYYMFVLDEQQKLLGVVSLHDLFKAPADKKIHEVMNTSVVTVTENQDQESVAHLFSQHKFLAIPVVDAERRVKGIITADDILHAVTLEATEDIQKMGGMEALNKPYLKVNFFYMLRKRGGWLAVLFLGEMLTASAMSHYEQTIAKAVMLALFIPLIISSGGNSGSQATTLIIRAMALGEVRLKDWWKIVYREFGMGLGLGLVLAVIGAVRIVIWQMIFHTYGPHYLLVAEAVSLSLICVVMWGTLAGSMLPFALRKFGFDPASSSAPLVATLVDVSGIVIYFTVSGIVLKGALL